MKKILKLIGGIVLAIIILVVLYIIVGRIVNAKMTKISTDNGIQESVTIDINGIQQELSIRGENTSNPVILFLHGGPGNPVGYFDYVWQPELNKDFTIVSFDQRGCGRTYYTNPEAEVSRELILEDIDGIVEYLKQRFGQEKIVIMGHSWGTTLGTMYAYSHPEKVSSYIGIGQVVNIYKGEEVAYKEAIKRANIHNDNEYIEVFKENYDQFCINGKIDDAFITYRNMQPKYLKGNKEKAMMTLAPAFLTSPTLKLQDAKWFLIDSNKVLLDETNTLTKSLFEFNANDMLEYEVPMYFISGGSDYITPFQLVEEYCESITAPDKKMIIIEGTGHNPYLDLPEVFVQKVRSLLKS